MYCRNCGFKNSDDDKFCSKCGSKIEEDTTNSVVTKIKDMPKKTKIIMVGVLSLVILAIIILSMLLSNPVKKVEDALNNYYTYFENYDNRYLVQIGKVLQSNKNDVKVLNSIKKTSNKAVLKWVKNFNKDYKDKEALDENYEKTRNAIKGMYQYFRGLEYVIDGELYQESIDELETLYNSKTNYFYGNSYKDSDQYQVYYYYQKVLEEDSYYKEAQEFVSDYIKDELDNLISEVKEKLEFTDIDREEKLDKTIDALEYLKEHALVNNIDLSEAKEYKELEEKILKDITNFTKEVVDTLESEEAIEKIEEVLKLFSDEEVKEYKELKELKESYEKKLPDKLVSLKRISYDSGVHFSNKKVIDGREYDSLVYFRIAGVNKAITYELNKEYQEFKTTIMKDQDIGDNFKGSIVFYGDGKEIYRTDNFQNSEEINFSVKDVQELKIEFVTESTVEGTSYIYLVEPYLYR